MLLVQRAERGWTWELVDEAGRTFASGRSGSQEAALAAAQRSYSLFDEPRTRDETFLIRPFRV